MAERLGTAYVDIRYDLSKLDQDLNTAKTKVTAASKDLTKAAAVESPVSMWGNMAGGQMNKLKSQVAAGAQGLAAPVINQVEMVAPAVAKAATASIANLAALKSAAAVAALGIAGAFAAVALAGAAMLPKIIEAGDRLDQLRAKVEGKMGVGAFQEAIDLANMLGISIEDASATLSRFAIAGEQLNLTNDQLVKMSKTLFQLGRLGGSSVDEVTAATRQFAQALASGRLQGDELRSILEQMPLVASAIAEELNVSVGALKEMGAQGQLTARVISGALLKAGDGVGESFAKLPETLGQTKQRFLNAIDQLFAEVDAIVHASDWWKSVINGATGSVQALTSMITGRQTPEQLRDQLSAARNPPPGFRPNDELAAELDQKLEDLRKLGQVMGGTAPETVNGLTAEERQKGLDTQLKLQTEIYNLKVRLQQEALDYELDAWEENERKKKAQLEKDASEAKSAAARAEADREADRRRAMTLRGKITDVEGDMLQGKDSLQVDAAARFKALKGEIAQLQQTYLDLLKEELALNDTASEAQQEAGDEAIAAITNRIEALGVEQKVIEDQLKREYDIRRDNERMALEAQREHFQRLRAEFEQLSDYEKFQAGDSEQGAVFDPMLGAQQTFKDLGEEALRTGELVGSAIRGGADVATDALTELVTTGKVKIKELAKEIEGSIVNGFIRMLINAGFGAAGNALFGQPGSGELGAGTMTSTSSGSSGVTTTTTTAIPAGAKGLAFDRSGIVPMARGGVVNGARIVPMARGGALIGEAGPEGVLPLRRDKNGNLGVMGGGGGGSNIQVIDQRGFNAPPPEVEKRNDGGKEMIHILIRDEVGAQLRSGDHSRALQSSYGIRQKPAR